LPGSVRAAWWAMSTRSFTVMDTDTDTHDPAARCAEAADHLHQVNQHLNAANEEARRFHTAIGHIGVQVQL